MKKFKRKEEIYKVTKESIKRTMLLSVVVGTEEDYNKWVAGELYWEFESGFYTKDEVPMFEEEYESLLRRRGWEDNKESFDDYASSFGYYTYEEFQNLCVDNYFSASFKMEWHTSSSGVKMFVITTCEIDWDRLEEERMKRNEKTN